MDIKKLKTGLAGLAMMTSFGALACPPALDRDVRKLRSDETINLCELTKNKVVLIVNTASQCGFTPQFKGLETLHQRYKQKGLVVIGFPSNDFRQEHSDETKTARVCYVNYGVSFNMTAPVSVKGDTADPVFKYLAESAGDPRWNFHKYLLDRHGKVIAGFPSGKTPAELADVIEAALGSQGT